VEIGPVDYAVIAFPGHHFTGELAPELARLVDGGIVRLLDLAFIKRSEDGTAEFFELETLDADETAAFQRFAIRETNDGLVSQDDLQLVAEELVPGTSAVVLVWENTWATEISAGVARAGGQLVAFERVPRSAVAAALADAA
jgi:hypothetical protein